TARLWEVATGQVVQVLPGHTDYVSAVAFSPDGRFVLTGSRDHSARLWEAATGQVVQVLQEHAWWVDAVAFSPDGRFMLIGSEDGAARLWEAASGQLVQVLQGHTAPVSDMAFSPDGRFMLTGSGDGAARLWDLATGQVMQVLQGPTATPTAVAFSPDGRFMLTGSQDGAVRLWDVATRQVVQVLQGHTAPVTAVAFSLNGQVVLTGSCDGTARLWNSTDGAEICQLVSFRNGDWAVVDPAGRYDASHSGDIKGLHWVANNEAIALAQLKQYYWEPGLLARLLVQRSGRTTEPLRDVQPLRAVALPPAVAYIPPVEGTTLTLQLTDRGGGIGQTRIKLNGVEVSRLQGQAPPARSPVPVVLSVELEKAATLEPGQDNTIEVITTNAEGYLRSRGVARQWRAPGIAAPSSGPHLYAIVVGAGEYQDPKLRLLFPRRDAEAMATALARGANRLFGAYHVHLWLLHSGRERPPTKANITQALAEVQQRARPGDIVVLYLSGHGVAAREGEQEIYYYLTADARSLEQGDPAVRAREMVSSVELAAWAQELKARKRVMILDTCAAGAAAIKLAEVREPSADIFRALDRLLDRSGFHVLMGSAADAKSYEASRYGHGVLTYSMLQGPRGPALREGSFIDVSQLFQFTVDTTPRLAAGIGGIQRPEVFAPKASSFDIGKLEEEDQKTLPGAGEISLILRPTLLNRDREYDDLDLETAVKTALREESYRRLQEAHSTASRGSFLPFVFVDDVEMSGGLRPSGSYVTNGQTVVATIVLVRDRQEVARRQVTGPAQDRAAVAAAIVEAITDATAAFATPSSR
ncbi:MAG TPA: caspase family protein, partial [Gammaproteobacteria bacterium]